MDTNNFTFVVLDDGIGKFSASFRSENNISYGAGGSTRNEAIAKAALMLIGGLDLQPSKGLAEPLGGNPQAS